MKLDWLSRHWSTAGITGAVLALLGIAALLSTQAMLSHVRDEAKTAARERGAMQAKLSQATKEQSEIGDKLDEYQRLRRRGMIGPEQRLDWVDALLIVQEENRLPELKYSIDPQKPLDYPGIPKSAEVQTLSSPMKLDLSMLHEGDLFRVLAGLRQRLPPYVAVKDCSIARPEGQGERLRASCTIDLITIRETP